MRPTLPILLMTGFTESVSEVANDGFPVLRKPFDLTTLRVELDAVWERHRVFAIGGERLESAMSSHA